MRHLSFTEHWFFEHDKRPFRFQRLSVWSVSHGLKSTAELWDTTDITGLRSHIQFNKQSDSSAHAFQISASSSAIFPSRHAAEQCSNRNCGSSQSYFWSRTTERTALTLLTAEGKLRTSNGTSWENLCISWKFNREHLKHALVQCNLWFPTGTRLGLDIIFLCDVSSF